MKVLVVGGAGYIGSHMVKLLGQQGCSRVTTLDDLSAGHRDAVLTGDFVQGSCGDRHVLDSVLARGFDAVMHFASFIQVGESVQHPDKYYQNNVVNTLALLDGMRVHGVRKFIFSSTAATFGEPQYTPIDERHPQQPINPHISVFGRDYDTPDGTCIRDYIHIQDLCSAHWLALQSLMDGADSHQVRTARITSLGWYDRRDDHPGQPWRWHARLLVPTAPAPSLGPRALVIARETSRERHRHLPDGTPTGAHRAIAILLKAQNADRCPFGVLMGCVQVSPQGTGILLS
jgi:hypothetical protein